MKNGMETKKRKSLAYPIAPSSSRRREGHVNEWRDWASLPRDVLCIVLGRLRQTDILRGAGLVCSHWRRAALEEPRLWRHIDLGDGVMPPWREPLPAGWKAMARVAVDRSAGRCKSFVGYVDADVLVHLANRHVLQLPIFNPNLSTNSQFPIYQLTTNCRRLCMQSAFAERALCGRMALHP
jgi:hypothetical protein